jgi:hypothetical protein
MFFKDDQKTIVIKADLSFAYGPGIYTDMCDNYFFKTFEQIAQYSFDVINLVETQLSFKVSKILQTFVFLNGHMYMVA